MLAEGEPQFLELNFTADMFTDPKEKQSIYANIDIENIRIEYGNDIIKTLAETGYSFRGASSLGEVAIAPGPEVFQRKIELWTPWYLVAQAFMTHGFDDFNAKKGLGKEEQEENQKIAKENAKRAAKQTQKALANLDKQLKPLNFKFILAVQGLFFSLNTNFENKRNLLQITTEPIKAMLVKENQNFGLSVMGIRIMTNSSFELLFQFSQQMQKTLAIYLDNPVLKDSKKLYQEIVTKKVIEDRKKHGRNFNMEPGFANIDASTIRPSGVGSEAFTFSEAPRFSAFRNSLAKGSLVNK